MPRAKVYESRAQQQAAYRERKAQAEQDAANEVELARFYEIGRRREPCPEGISNAECVAWAKGVWQAQANAMPKPRRVPVPK